MNIVFSFDDGRIDQYGAFKILKKYDLKGTFHITTGFIDGTFQTDNFGKYREPLSLIQLKEMFESGMEISSHGDRHITDSDDFITSYNKLKTWGLIENDTIGFSVPNSDFSNEQLIKFYADNKDHLTYIRVGRSPKCFSIKSKMNYGFYHLFHNQTAFDNFNKYNLIDDIDKERIVSLVIKKDSTAKNVISFIHKHKDENYLLVLMFHSVLTSPRNKWEYSIEEFEKICKYLRDNSIAVSTLKEALKKEEKM